VTPLAGIRVEAQYTYLHTAVTDAGVSPADDAAFRAGETLLRRPAHSAAGRMRTRVGPADLSGAVRWTGSRADADFAAYPATRVVLPAFVVVDLAAELRLLRARGHAPGAALALALRNLLDEQYQQAYGFPAPGRTVLLGARLGAGN
jgi:outer membrane cobalamin receptor